LIHLLPPDKQYRDEKGRTLIDGVKGDNNFRSGKWVGFRNNKMETLMVFNQPSVISTVSASTLVDIGSYLMPPSSLEVWGGNDSQHLKLLGVVKPQQPGKIKPSYQTVYEIKIKPVSLKYLKLIVTPVSKLPNWHPGKGNPAWFFTDEILVN